MSLEDELLKQRLARIQEIEALGYRPYGSRYEFTHTVPQILAEYGSKTAEELTPQVRVRVAGRLMAVRPMGKAGFGHIQQNGERLQFYIKKDGIGERDFQLFKMLDIGDIIGVEGYLFRTRTGELSIHAERLEFLSKTLLSMPEKWHGLEDVEIRYRQRYLDLIANPEVRNVFVKRARIVSSLRRQLEAQGFIEVETPMMQPLYGGAAARPFVTHHNTLDIDLYLRIAPELYLKRLVVGGLERVYEINRNFRNEGLSTRHNPEFTMLEFYQAYTDYHGLMDFTAELLAQVASMPTAPPPWNSRARRSISAASSATPCGKRWSFLGRRDEAHSGRRRRPRMAARAIPAKPRRAKRSPKYSKCTRNRKLIQPTIIYDYPVETSPLSKNKPDDPALVDRFEIFAAGMEIGNAFTELNDPQEQRRRFEMQLAMREHGDEEAHQMDEDYVRALCLRHAAGRRRRHRDRPAYHDPHQLALHPRCHPLPAAPARRARSN